MKSEQEIRTEIERLKSTYNDEWSYAYGSVLIETEIKILEWVLGNNE